MIINMVVNFSFNIDYEQIQLFQHTLMVWISSLEANFTCKFLRSPSASMPLLYMNPIVDMCDPGEAVYRSGRYRVEYYFSVSPVVELSV